MFHDHGTASRVKTCGCLDCCARNKTGVRGQTVRWPLRPLLRAGSKGSLDKLRDMYGDDQILIWTAFGLQDIEADTVSIRLLGVTAHEVWRGYGDVGLEYDLYP